MAMTKNKIRKQKINLIIPKRCNHNLIILKNNDYDVIVPNI